jgi:hypothetical protein
MEIGYYNDNKLTGSIRRYFPGGKEPGWYNSARNLNS